MLRGKLGRRQWAALELLQERRPLLSVKSLPTTGDTVVEFHDRVLPRIMPRSARWGSDDAYVKSVVLERYQSLAEAGYEAAIGVRDVYPHFEFDQLDRFRAGLETGVSQHPLKLSFILGVMEVEAWFLAEYSHYPLIHQGITAERIRNELGFDVINDDLQKRPHPSGDLADTYRLEKVIYDKSESRVLRTIQALNFVNLKSVSRRFPDLERLFDRIESFVNDR